MIILLVVLIFAGIFLFLYRSDLEISKRVERELTLAKPERILNHNGEPIDEETILKEIIEGKKPIPFGWQRSTFEKIAQMEHKLRTDGLYHTICHTYDHTTRRKISYTWFLAFLPNGYVVKLKRDGEIRLTKDMLAEIESTRFDFDPSAFIDAGEDFCRYKREGNNLLTRFFPFPNEQDCYVEFSGTIGLNKLTLDLNQFETTYYGPNPGLKKKELINGSKFDFYKFPSSTV